MDVKTFENMLIFWRHTFRFILNSDSKLIYYGYGTDHEKISLKEWIVKECFGKCTSSFEEETVAEVLHEEFMDYLSDLQNNERQ